MQLGHGPDGLAIGYEINRALLVRDKVFTLPMSKR
jgi:hypothetical protein